MLDLNKIFDPRVSQELNTVIITSGRTTSGGSVPNGGLWTDFEELNFSVSRTVDSPQRTWVTRTLKQQDFRNDGDNVVVDFSDEATRRQLQLTFNSDGSYTITGIVGDACIQNMVGYKKKYATTNLTTTIDVNGGNPITVNRRYEIPANALPSEMLNDDGTIKSSLTLIPKVSASGSAYNGFLDAQSESVVCGVAGNKLLVATGTKLVDSAKLNLWGVASDVTSAPCEIVAILSGETYVTQVAGNP